MSDRSIVFPDGSSVQPSLYVRGKWLAWWADRTPLRGDNDERSYFHSADEAVAALIEGGEGPQAGHPRRAPLGVDLVGGAGI